jgi:hypothetical protein
VPADDTCATDAFDDCQAALAVTFFELPSENRASA